MLYETQCGGQGYASSFVNSSEVRKNIPTSNTREKIPARVITPAPLRGSEQVIPTHVAGQETQKTQPAVAVESAKQASTVTPHPKVDYATDLFNLLSVDGSSAGNATEASGEDLARISGFIKFSIAFTQCVFLVFVMFV